MRDYVVVGGGMGGALSAAILSKRSTVLLLEKEPYLGGCASTFSHKGDYYNAGATTLAMYEKGLPVYEMFERAGVAPNSKRLEYSHIVLQGSSRIKIYSNVDSFVEELDFIHYHKRNLEFWRLVKKICDDFYRQDGYIFSGKNLPSKIKSALSFAPMVARFLPYLAHNAQSFIRSFFGGKLSGEYVDFLDAQTMVAVQAKTSKINFLTAALALGYPFSGSHYVYGGMGSIFQELSKNIDEVKLESEVCLVSKIKSGYVVETRESSYEAKNVVLNTPVFLNSKFFQKGAVKSYFESLKSLDSKQGAFVVYVKLRTKKEFAAHYQIIEKESFAHTISNTLFVSFSDKNDPLLSKEEGLSVTISVHTHVDYWLDISRQEYLDKKNELTRIILSLICAKLGILDEEIVDVFSATPRTFEKYIGRSSLGGVVMTPSNQLRLASNDTPFEGLFVVGDSSFAAQGWPGVAMGVKNFLCMT